MIYLVGFYSRLNFLYVPDIQKNRTNRTEKCLFLFAIYILTFSLLISDNFVSQNLTFGVCVLPQTVPKCAKKVNFGWGGGDV
jgi:hypothetical protein